MASLAIDAPQKWVDNVLSQHDVPGVPKARRGLARRIPRQTLIQLALLRDLHVGLGLSVRDALALSRELLGDDGAHDAVRGCVRVVLDRARLERAMDNRLRDALESAPSPRRGRPTRRRGSVE